METNDMLIEPGGLVNGTYRIHSRFDGESIAITAQGLLDLAAWTTEHKEQLQTEAQECNMASLDAQRRG